MSSPLHIQQFSNGGKHPVVFLHGFMGSSDEWEAVCEHLPDIDGYAIDLPGHGQSLCKADEDYTLHAAADLVLETLDAKGIQRAALVGYSMGGRVALYLALRNPSRWSNVVIESASPGLKSVKARQARYFIDLAKAKELEDDYPTFLKTWYEQKLFASLREKPDVLESHLERLRGNSPKHLAKSLRTMTIGRQLPLWKRLKESELDFLLLSGELDEKYCDMLREMEQELQYATHSVLPNVGHNIHLEDPRAFAQALGSFLGVGRASVSRCVSTDLH